MTRTIRTKLIVLILSVMMLTTSLLLPYAATSSANELPVVQGELNDLTDNSEGKNLNSVSSGNIEYINYYYIDHKVQPNLILKPNTKYSVSFDYVVNSLIGFSYLESAFGYGDLVYDCDINEVEIINTQQLSHFSHSFVTPLEFDASFGTPYLWLRLIRTRGPADLNADYFNLMINEGDPLPYVPYLSSIQDLTYSYNGTIQTQTLYYYNYITLKKWIDTYLPHFYNGNHIINVYSSNAKTNLLYSCKSSTSNIDYRFTSKVFIEIIYVSQTELGDFDGLLGLADMLFGGIFTIVNLTLKILFNDIRLFTVPVGFYFMAVILIGIVFSIMNKFKGGD